MIAEQLTLVIVGYKHERYVTTLLESVEAQTMLPARILLVDDDPVGGTAEAAEQYLTKSALQVELTRNQVNQGLCTSLNTALESVDTEYYAYISADDWMMPQRLERQLAAFGDADPHVAAVYSNAVRVDENGTQLPEDFKTAYDWPEDRNGDIFLTLVRQGWIPAPSVLLRTESVRGVGGYDPELFFEDHDLWLRLARHHRFICLDEPLVAFRELGTSLGHTEFNSENPRFIEAYIKMLSKHIRASPEIDREIAPRVWNLALRLWKATGPSPKVAGYLASSIQGASSRGLGKMYVLLSRHVNASAVDRLRKLGPFRRTKKNTQHSTGDGRSL